MRPGVPTHGVATMKTKPVWREVELPQFAPIASDQKFDVLIVGGGITGLTTAYLLKKMGKTVCVLERDRLGGGDTERTTAHLSYVTDTRLSELVKTFGKDAARLTWHGGMAAIDCIEAIAEHEQIDCAFRRLPGFLHASLLNDENETKDLQKDADLARDLGFAASFVERVPYLNKPGVRFPNQARFHPLAYLAGLAKAIHGD